MTRTMLALLATLPVAAVLGCGTFGSDPYECELRDDEGRCLVEPGGRCQEGNDSHACQESMS